MITTEIQMVEKIQRLFTSIGISLMSVLTIIIPTFWMIIIRDIHSNFFSFALFIISSLLLIVSKVLFECKMYLKENT